MTPPNRETHILLLIMAAMILSVLLFPAWLARTKPTPTVTAMPIPTLTPIPQFITLPPPIILADLILTDRDFFYIPLHYVPDNTVVWLLFGWPEEELLYKAVFGVEGGEWVLFEVEKMGNEDIPISLHDR